MTGIIHLRFDHISLVAFVQHSMTVSVYQTLKIIWTAWTNFSQCIVFGCTNFQKIFVNIPSLSRLNTSQPNCNKRWRVVEWLSYYRKLASSAARLGHNPLFIGKPLTPSTMSILQNTHICMLPGVGCCVCDLKACTYIFTGRFLNKFLWQQIHPSHRS